MKRTDGDKLIKHKMESFDTLSGGIVFGKEEAWEKLQARMERKPARIIPVKYWLTAAAVLLLFVSIFGVHFYPGKEVAKNEPGAPEKEIPNAPAVHQETGTGVNGQPGIATKKIRNYRGGNDKNKGVLNRRERSELTQQEMVYKQPVPVPVDDPKKNIDVIAENKNTAPVLPAVKTMKVVHINDIENNAGMPDSKTSIVIANLTRTDFSKMPVVHINDVEQEAVEFKTILRDNRNTVVRNLFGRPPYSDFNSNTEEYTQPHNLLKSIFNTQN